MQFEKLNQKIKKKFTEAGATVIRFVIAVWTGIHRTAQDDIIVALRFTQLPAVG